MKDKKAKISDTHIGSYGFKRGSRELFTDFLRNYVVPEAAELEMLGDMFELAGIYGFEEILRVERKVVEALQEASESARIIYRLGNHDIDLPVERFREEFPYMELRVPGWQRVILRKGVGSERAEPKEVHRVLYTGDEEDGSLADHGYIYDHYFFDSPRRWRWLTKIGEGLQHLTGQGIEERFRRMFVQRLKQKAVSSRTGSYNMREIRRRGGNIYWLMLAARDAAMYEVSSDNGAYRVERRKNPLKRVFFGHTHVQDRRKIYDEVLEEKGPVLYRDGRGRWAGVSEYFNTGCFKDGRSDFTLILPDGSAENHQWKGFRDGYKKTGRV